MYSGKKKSGKTEAVDYNSGENLTIRLYYGA